jgi:soluble lytic murein transglycosylase
MAYRDARGAPRLRAGLYAVYTNDAPPRRAMDFATRKARSALDGRAQAVLREVATTIGDPGIALRFGLFRPDARPRAYAELVQLAATKYGVDPNLLFAVMRVESIYNRRIVSYAGAVGLMQIMPTTGRRIAIKLGKNDFRTSDLLDPSTNLDGSLVPGVADRPLRGPAAARDRVVQRRPAQRPGVDAPAPRRNADRRLPRAHPV